MPQHKLYVSPPFGNYMYWMPGITCIYGSFTRNSRPGLLGQVFKTLRYSIKHNGWYNKIGLRNCGIETEMNNMGKSLFAKTHRNNVVSLAILCEDEIDDMVKIVGNDTNLEINVSCPNTDGDMVNTKIEKFINPDRRFCSIKLRPTTSFEEIDKYYNMGFRTFNFSNTLKYVVNGITLGGLSGITLVPYTEKLVAYTRATYGDKVEIIAGGGVRNMETAKRYMDVGADHISVSTLCFNPIMFLMFYFQFDENYKVIQSID